MLTEKDYNNIKKRTDIAKKLKNIALDALDDIRKFETADNVGKAAEELGFAAAHGKMLTEEAYKIIK